MPPITVTRTYLEMTDPSQLRAVDRIPAGARVERLPRCSAELFRYLYATVGGPYHWIDRLSWDDATVQEYLSRPGVLIRVLRRGPDLAGYYELVRHDTESVEIAYFGLLPGFLGQGLGGFLLTEAVEEAWAMGVRRVWLHTCTLDGPAALPNYLARGFQAFHKEEYEADLP